MSLGNRFVNKCRKIDPYVYLIGINCCCKSVSSFVLQNYSIGKNSVVSSVDVFAFCHCSLCLKYHTQKIPFMAF